MISVSCRRLVGVSLLAAIGLRAADASSPPDYRDDRSSAETLIQSLYNAIGRKEYLRAWSYFGEGAAAPFETFAAGYADTDAVRVRIGTVGSEGAAGSIFYSAPVVVEATEKGEPRVFAGCYELRLVQPAVQATPPFSPLHIVKGRLEPVAASFENADGACPAGGLR